MQMGNRKTLKHGTVQPIHTVIMKSTSQNPQHVSCLLHVNYMYIHPPTQPVTVGSVILYNSKDDRSKQRQSQFLTLAQPLCNITRLTRVNATQSPTQQVTGGSGNVYLRQSPEIGIASLCSTQTHGRNCVFCLFRNGLSFGLGILKVALLSRKFSAQSSSVNVCNTMVSHHAIRPICTLL